MKKNQYTITERNDWEKETFGYIMDLTKEEVDFIAKKIKKFDPSGKIYEFSPSKYTSQEVKKINKISRNGYMDRLNFYEFKKENAIEGWKEFGDLFYKGNGLKIVE